MSKHPSSVAAHDSAVFILHEGLSSGKRVETDVPAGTNPRAWWLDHFEHCQPPWISSSAFISPEMVEHLMRHKVDQAIAVKSTSSGAVWDQRITNMEGMLHSFVVPLVFGYLHGDYEYKRGHLVRSLGTALDMQFARPVIISALIHPDFENFEVMRAFITRGRVKGANPIVGYPWMAKHLPDDGLSPKATTIPTRATVGGYFHNQRLSNEDWDQVVKDLTLRHLFEAEHFDSWGPDHALLGSNAIFNLLEKAIHSDSPRDVVHGLYFKTPGATPESRPLSLESLFLVVLEQVKNELLALEHICQKTGYIYTFDPAVIFRRSLGSIGRRLMLSVHAAALRQFSLIRRLRAMKVLGYNDFESPEALGLIRAALRDQDVCVISKADLFMGNLKTGELYSPSPEFRDAMLVLHNNSDGFGQNIETEVGTGSMDAAIGSYSSAAASLRRDRGDLLSPKHMMFWPPLSKAGASFRPLP